MSEIVFKELTVDNLFDFCEVLDALGVESILGQFDEEEMKAFQEKDAGAVGMSVIMKTSNVIIKSLPRIRNEVCTFLAGCAEWDDGTAVTVEDIRKMKISRFVKLIRDFFMKDGIKDFFGEAAELLDTEQPNSKNSVTDVIPMPTVI